METIFLTSLLLFPFFLILIQSGLNRLLKGSNQKRALIAILVSLSLFSILWVFLGDGWMTSFYAFFYSLLVGYSYFHLFNMSETSRRIKILVTLSGQSPLSLREMGQFYKEDEVVSVRMERLVDLGQVRQNGISYILSSRILYGPAVFMMWFRKVLKIE